LSWLFLFRTRREVYPEQSRRESCSGHKKSDQLDRFFYLNFFTLLLPIPIGAPFTNKLYASFNFMSKDINSNNIFSSLRDNNISISFGWFNKL